MGPAPTKTNSPFPFLGWLPILLLNSSVFAWKTALPPWAFMWLTAIALFAGFKWWAWWSAVFKVESFSLGRSIAFLFLWPGMDAEEFLTKCPSTQPKPSEWLFAAGKTAFGAALMWGAARFFGTGLTAGWVGMIGLIFVLHFGLFHLIALFWQTQGVAASPIMRWPLLADSLGDFWGKRWNSGFRDLAFDILFARLAKRIPPRFATFLVFLVSGLIHELVITVPAGAGFGLPTLYFTIQGFGLLIERSRLWAKWGLRRSVLARVFAFSVVLLPIAALFPPVFVRTVMVPFFQFIWALPQH